MATYQKVLESECLKSKVEERDLNHDLFKAKPGRTQLLVHRVSMRSDQDGSNNLALHLGETVADSSQIKALEKTSSDVLQIYSVSQERTWTTLDISREVFEDFLKTFNVFAEFWKCALVFGRKSEENEFEFPGFRTKRSQTSGGKSEAIELAYVLRRVELNRRELGTGQSPWSIRQTAVYHKFNSTDYPSLNPAGNECLPTRKWRSALLLIAISENLEQEIRQDLQTYLSRGQELPWQIQRQIVAESMENWMDYMAHLEEQMRDQSDKIVFAAVGTEKENLSPLTDFNINFVDRQTLKILEDSVIDLQVILPTLLETVIGIRDQCRKFIVRCKPNKEEIDRIELVSDELDEYVRVARCYVERAKILRQRATAIAQLLSDLLSYEEAVALKDLSKESHKEGKEMHRLTERSTRDAAAVKILTVITLIYLPTTIVANFFSTQFVQTSDDGHMKLTHNAWLLAAISIPLTVLTVATWALWVFLTRVTPPPVFEHPRPPNILRQSSFRSVRTAFSWKKERHPGTANSQKLAPTFQSIFSATTRKRKDEELALPNTAICPANIPGASAAATT